MLKTGSGLLAAAVVITAAVRLSAHDPIGTKVTWDREIAPLFQARCVSCHSTGGKAPMALTTYDETRPWARAIREEVLTRRMPKWHIVRGYGDFRNDPSLSAFEIALITAWVDGGAPRTRPGAPAGRPPDARAADIRGHAAATRRVRASCQSSAVLSGRLVGVNPETSRGGSVRVTLSSTAAAEPVLWVRDYDPDFAPTYWLRRPIELTPETRILVEGTAPCALTFLLETQTAQ